jgi:hypothetical protein
MTLGSQEFLRRFLLQVVPRGFVRIPLFSASLPIGGASLSRPFVSSRGKSVISTDRSGSRKQMQGKCTAIAQEGVLETSASQ